jgi:hypothetical protein
MKHGTTISELNVREVTAVAGGVTNREIANSVLDFFDGFCSEALLPVTIIIGLAVVDNYVKNHPEQQRVHKKLA